MTAITIEQLRCDPERYLREVQTAPIAIEINGQVVAMLKAADSAARVSESDDRNRLMDSLLKATAHFRVGPQPTREEMNER